MSMYSPTTMDEWMREQQKRSDRELRKGRGVPRGGPVEYRDIVHGVPADEADRVALAARGAVWFNTETGWQERYFAAASDLDASPAFSALTPGWYPLPGTVLFIGTVGSTAHTSNVFRYWGESGFAYVERYDPYAMHDPVTNPGRLTPPVPGYVGVDTRQTWDANTSGNRATALRIAGVDVPGRGVQVTAAENSGGNFPTNGPVAVGVGQYLEVGTRQTSGGSLNLLSGEVVVSFIRPIPS